MFVPLKSVHRRVWRASTRATGSPIQDENMSMDLATIDQASETFLNQWKRLVSTTNWDKGRIIASWRQALIDADAPVSDYSDEAWSLRVGNVTPQHVGRLRRVWERFDAVRETYDGLFWSHFQAALDWDDAEMWLEGAVQNDWSISEMRSARSTALGMVNGEASADGIASDIEPDQDGVEGGIEALEPTIAVVHDAEGFESAYEDAPFGDSGESESSSSRSSRASSESHDSDGDLEGDYQSGAASTAKPVRPFADLPSLPADVSDAFEAYKLCILRHKLADLIAV
jgi:hypothetical protein